MEDIGTSGTTDAPRTASAPTRYASVAMLLHWVTAAAFAFQIGLGWRMGDAAGPGTFTAYQLHKSIGITILLLTVLRVGWRLAHPAPPLSPTLTPVERGLARTVHAGFYVLLLAMPFSGWLIVSTSTTAIPTFLFGTIPLPHLPVPAALRAGTNGAAAVTHSWLAWIALAMIALHVLGALKHQLIDRDGELRRMVPAPRAVLPWLAVLLPVGVVGLMAAGRTAMTATAAPPKVAEPAPIPVPAPQAAPAPIAAVPPPPAAVLPDATAVPAATATVPSAWTVRSAGRRIGFRTAWSQGTVDGTFGSWSATITFDPAALDQAAATVTIDLASAATAAGDQQAALPGDDWFSAAAHPKAVWRATGFRALGGDRYRATGTLTLRGVTRPQTVDLTIRITGDVARVSGSATVDRTAFGVGQGEWAATTDLPAGVKLDIALTADRKR